ncbi:RNA polymerase sigma-70 factor, ECF subfamily [Zhouia amylolytica]|uniref:Uncharacterized protein n=2 Tax=Zhouia amylolytica TaxID=376730 RepID=W2URT7_9FLAO|nr:RNA polymerase sigma factor [Zhouia amylolytica]ETN96032.1 hypothetical protein P278_17540 [Zhouia amylolytica AD3]SFS50534.1 RNA polymerase sigma-70 factor, ECF subfamily [Zhouia amylolytica]
MTNLTDHNYIEKTLQGDTLAFSNLVEKYQDMVFSIAFKLLRNREEAEDAAQDAFVKCYHSLPKFKGEAKFSSWLYRIVYNTSLDRLKANKKSLGDMVVDEISEGELESVETTLNYIEGKERSAIIKAAVEKLPSEEQVLILLYYFEELSLREITEVVDISLENIKVRLFRSRKKLFKLLKNEVEFLKRSV